LDVIEGVCLMKQQIIAGCAGIALVTLAAMGAYASQDSVASKATTLLEPVETGTTTTTATATETATATGTEEATQIATATDTPVPTATEAAATGTPEATETGEADDEHGEREIKGIPTENKNHPDAEDPDNCEKGEAVTKITPSGVEVRVPCQATKHGENSNGSHGHGNGHDGDDQDEDESSDQDD
jgi:hypothetical protein